MSLTKIEPECCGNCVFYDPINRKAKIGQCLRFPPSSALIKGDKGEYEESYAIPMVPKKHWCGEWTLDDADSEILQ